MASLNDDRRDVERCDHSECRQVSARYGRARSWLAVRDGSNLLVDRDGRIKCHQPVRLVMSCRGVREIPCNVRDSDRCPPCADRNNRRLRRKFEEGIRCGKKYVYFVTLGAPGEPDHNRFIPGKRGLHGVCGCEVGMGSLAEWNAQASTSWNRFATRLRATFDGVGYGRAVEVQDGKRRKDGLGRGALHNHCAIVSDVPISIHWFHAQALAAGFGCVIDVQEVTNPAAVAAYISKYTTKGGRDRAMCKWLRESIDMQTGELIRSTWPTYRAWSASQGFGPTIKHLRELARVQARARAAELLAAGVVDELRSVAWPAVVGGGSDPP